MRQEGWKAGIGAAVVADGVTRFRVWAPKAKALAVTTFTGGRRASIPMEPEEDGYFSATIEGVGGGDRYLYLPQDAPPRPDPASRFQPEGVHAPSQVVDHRLYRWQDQGWRGVPLDQYVMYEIHVGTLTREGTFTAVIPHLDYLKELGITALELMPVAQFPGTRNWGYDGVYPFAPQNSYGGPEGLKKLVDACHAKGMAVILDVVYNHLGPEGNYLSEFGHYFTSTYQTPWGNAVNFDGPYSDAVCDFFLANALYWLNDFHLDALRLDAVHGIFDFSAHHFLKQLADAVAKEDAERGRERYLIAESALNDVRLITPGALGGYGLHAQWNDDFHHALHTLLTGERSGYYEDYGSFGQLTKALSEGFVYSGEYSPYRKRRHGNSSRDVPPSRLVAFAQNHDQVGNRMTGDRLSTTLAMPKLTMVAALVLFSPYLPLLFMGEEYGEKAPFQYFVDHGDPALIEGVRRGRSEEFACFAWKGEVPDPKDEATFLRSRVDLAAPRDEKEESLLTFYRKALQLRRDIPALRDLSRGGVSVGGFEEERVIALGRKSGRSEALCLFNLSEKSQEVPVELSPGSWQKVLDSALPQWKGRGELSPREITVSKGACRLALSPLSAAVYLKGY